MKYGIIAAGEGSRLANESVLVPKPLVTLHGETLIDRLIRIFADNDAEEIVIITRQEIPVCNKMDVPIRQIVKETPSSLHSFYEISKYLVDSPFILTTVDTVFKEVEFARYVQTFKTAVENGYDGMMGVTDYIDDEKPLYIKANDTIEAFLDSDPNHECSLISGGIYGLTPKAIDTLNRCHDEGQHRMRNFQRALLADGHKLATFSFSKIIDIDHATDIEKAERFLKGKVLGINRAAVFSPNCIEKDRKIMSDVLSLLKRNGYETSCIDEEAVYFGELPKADIYISMARHDTTLAKLQGHKVINAPTGTSLCNNRHKLAQKAKELGIEIPEVVENPTKQDIRTGLWIKRAIGTTIDANDTVFCTSQSSYISALAHFKERGINDVIIERHVYGDLIKFYGVCGTDFFNIGYPSEKGKTKFGLEVFNGKCHHYAFDKDLFESKVKAMAEAIGIRVFGGDAIIREDSSYVIIDFNDWPSFSSCSEEASVAIASIIDNEN